MRKLKMKLIFPILALVRAQGSTRYIESNKYAAADEFFREDNWNDYAGLWIEHNDFLVSTELRINLQCKSASSYFLKTIHFLQILF
jgi:hypothetical protein